MPRDGGSDADRPAPPAPPDPPDPDEAGVDPDEVRRMMAERHFMLSQAVIERFEELLDLLAETERALEGAGLRSLAETTAEEAERTREEIEEWRAFQEEVEGYLEGGGDLEGTD